MHTSSHLLWGGARGHLQQVGDGGGRLGLGPGERDSAAEAWGEERLDTGTCQDHDTCTRPECFVICDSAPLKVRCFKLFYIPCPLAPGPCPTHCALPPRMGPTRLMKPGGVTPNRTSWMLLGVEMMALMP